MVHYIKKRPSLFLSRLSNGLQCMSDEADNKIDDEANDAEHTTDDADDTKIDEDDDGIDEMRLSNGLCYGRNIVHEEEKE